MKIIREVFENIPPELLIFDLIIGGVIGYLIATFAQ